MWSRHGCRAPRRGREVRESRESAGAGDAQRKMEVGKEKGRLPGTDQSPHVMKYTCAFHFETAARDVPGRFNDDVDAASACSPSSEASARWWRTRNAF